jgi:hypothetical protein
MKRVVAATVFVLVLSTVNLVSPVSAQSKPSAPDGYVLVEEDVIVTFADEPRKNFRSAVSAFLNRKLNEAATDIRKGAAFMKLEAERATGDAKKVLADAVADLQKLADDVQKGVVADLKDLQNSFARAEHALARHHYMKAVELREKNETQKAGRELQTAADYVDSGQVWLTKKMHKGTQDVVNEARRVAGKMVAGAGASAEDIGKAFDNLGKELDRVAGTPMTKK